MVDGLLGVDGEAAIVCGREGYSGSCFGDGCVWVGVEEVEERGEGGSGREEEDFCFFLNDEMMKMGGDGACRGIKG